MCKTCHRPLIEKHFRRKAEQRKHYTFPTGLTNKNNIRPLWSHTEILSRLQAYTWPVACDTEWSLQRGPPLCKLHVSLLKAYSLHLIKDFYFRYDDFDVPDTMKVHGVYDTSTTMYTFYSREEYKKWLQQQAGMAGSHFGFFAGVKMAWGSSSLSGSERYMSLLSIDIDRWVKMHFKASLIENPYLNFILSLWHVIRPTLPVLCRIFCHPILVLFGAWWELSAIGLPSGFDPRASKSLHSSHPV